jgi:hypothetical protein
MFMKKYTALLFLVSGLARAGGISSSGGELRTTEDNPWFDGDAVVSYCLDTGAPSDFSATPAQAGDAVRAVLDDWLATIARAAVAPLDPRSVSSPARFSKTLATKFVAVGCQEPHRLTFALGVTPPAVAEALAFHAKFTVALALNDGIIWLAPDRGEHAYTGPHAPDFWAAGALKNVLAHEIGHMFGIGHDDEDQAGVMAETFPARAVQSPAFPAYRGPAYFAEDNWWLTGAPRCGQGLAGRAARTALGLRADGRIEVCLRHDAGRFTTVAVQLDGAAASFQTTPFSPGCRGGGVPCDSGPLTVRTNPVHGFYPEGEFQFFRLVDYVSLQGTLTLPDGRKLPALIEQKRNGRLKLTVIDGGFASVQILPRDLNLE